MTRVDFYVLGTSEPRQRYLFACRLVEKAWQLGNKLHIRASNLSEARYLDEILWTFRQGSFIPHVLEDASSGNLAPITIGLGSVRNGNNDVLVNLAMEVPEDYASCKRVVELVDEHEGVKRAGRERFRFYRREGVEPEMHNMVK